MGGSEAVEWLDALEASFEAGLAREEETAAADLAFSLGQDVDVREAILRSRGGWAVSIAEGAWIRVDEVGVDYVGAGDLVVPAARAALRSGETPAPRATDRRFLELLGTLCRGGAEVDIESHLLTGSGRLLRVAKDHVAMKNGMGETIVGLGSIQAVRIRGYSASRGFSG